MFKKRLLIIFFLLVLSFQVSAWNLKSPVNIINNYLNSNNLNATNASFTNLHVTNNITIGGAIINVTTFNVNVSGNINALSLNVSDLVLRNVSLDKDIQFSTGNLTITDGSDPIMMFTQDDNVLIKRGKLSVNYGLDKSPIAQFYVGGSNNGTVGTSPITQIDTEISNPFLSFGYYTNFILQSEVMGTSWNGTNISVGAANGIIAPYGIAAAERITPNSSASSFFQNSSLSIATAQNVTLVVYLKTPNATGSVISLNIIGNLTAPTETNISLSNNWVRYFIVRELAANNYNITPMFLFGNVTVDIWGAQLEFNKTMPSVYCGATTTARITTPTLCSFIRQPTTINGALTVNAALVLAGTITGATTISASGAIGSSPATIATGLGSIGLQLYSATLATAAIPIQNSARAEWYLRYWNGTAQQDNYGLQSSGNNITKLNNFTLRYSTTLGINTTVWSIITSTNTSLNPRDNLFQIFYPTKIENNLTIRDNLVVNGSVNITNNISVNGLSANLTIFTNNNKQLITRAITQSDITDVVYRPHNVTVTVGTTTSTLSNLSSCNDDSIFEVTEAANTPGFNMTIYFANVTKFRLGYNLAYYSGTTSHYVSLYFKECSTGNFLLKNTLETGNNFVETDMTVMNQSRFNCGGNVTIQYLHPVAGNPAHFDKIDCSQLLG